MLNMATTNFIAKLNYILKNLSFLIYEVLADPGKAMGCSTNYKQTDPFPPTALRRRHAQTVIYRYFSYSDK